MSAIFKVFIGFVIMLLLFHILDLGPKAYGILAPWLGIEHAPPAMESKVLTTGSPGKSPKTIVLNLQAALPIIPNIYYILNLKIFFIFLLHEVTYMQKCTAQQSFTCVYLHTCNHQLHQDTGHFQHPENSCPLPGNKHSWSNYSSDFRQHRLVLAVLELSVNWFVKHVFLCVWFLSLNIILLIADSPNITRTICS